MPKGHVPATLEPGAGVSVQWGPPSSPGGGLAPQGVFHGSAAGINFPESLNNGG